MDGGETAKQCILREAEEEINIKIEPEDIKVTHVMHCCEPDREYIDVYLKADKWRGEITNKEPEKCDEIKWYSIDKLPDNVVPKVRNALYNTQNGIFYSEFGWQN